MPYDNLVAAATALEADYADEGEILWQGSPFAWIRSYKPATIGAIGRRLVQSIFNNAGINVQRVGMRLNIDGVYISLKTSMQWTAGRTVFEQIKDDDSDYVFCLAIFPDSARAWLIPQTEVFDNGIIQTREGLTGQHTGSTGTETAWLSFDSNNPPTWLQEYGGTIEATEARIQQIFG